MTDPVPALERRVLDSRLPRTGERRTARSRRSWLPLRSSGPRRRRTWQPVLPVGMWAALALVIFGVPVVVTTAYVGAVPGFGVLAGMTALAALIGHQWGRELRTFARGISQAGAGEPLAVDPIFHGARELRGLDAAMTALHLRIQVADELAERYRRDAESAGSGMFELLSGLVAAEEGTRGQLAAELHDTVAQSLGTARRLLADAGPSAGTDALGAITPLVEEAEEALRATMARARPAALRDGDLAAAVSRFRDDLELRYGLRVTLEWPVAAYPLPLATAVTIYRFFQEALINVVKHADVDDAVASLTVEAGHVTAVVRDSGPGFDMSRQPVAGVGGRHVGLGAAAQRARLAGGSVDVMSAPGAGTMLSLRLPRPAVPVQAAALITPAGRLPASRRLANPATERHDPGRRRQPGHHRQQVAERVEMRAYAGSILGVPQRRPRAAQLHLGVRGLVGDRAEAGRRGGGDGAGEVRHLGAALG